MTQWIQDERGLWVLRFGLLLFAVVVVLVGTTLVINQGPEPETPAIDQGAETMIRNFGDANIPAAVMSTSRADDVTPSAGSQTLSVDAKFVYLLGVEGSGHHGVFPLIEGLAKSQPGVVVHSRKTKGLFHEVKSLSDGPFKPREVSSVLTDLASSNPQAKHVFLEDRSFPTGGQRAAPGSRPAAKRKKTAHAIKSSQDTQEYNIETLTGTLVGLGVEVKNLLIVRPFYKTVYSHKQWDGGLTQHALVIGNFMEHISREIRLVEDVADWRRINYEDINAHCAALSLGLCSFLAWKPPEDTAAFCAELFGPDHLSFHQSKKVPKLKPAQDTFLNQLWSRGLKRGRWEAYFRPGKGLTPRLDAVETQNSDT